ncbi:MAG: lysyl endopeptidase [Saccharothrix sp.]|nr:lysyl endopeptidase [Saccharothrix sp.]
MKRLSCLILVIVALTSAPVTSGQPAGAVPTTAGGRSAAYRHHQPLDGDDQAIKRMRDSGFTTFIVWDLHVHGNGDLYYNDTKVVSDGVYVGPAGWWRGLMELTRQPTSVTRVEFAIGEAGSADWQSIDELMKTEAGKRELRSNFATLLTTTKVDVINNDDESHYDVDSTVAFAKLLQGVGYRSFAITPYQDMAYWKEVIDRLGPLVDRVYLQMYDGGATNNLKEWAVYLGRPIDPGMRTHSYAPSCTQGDGPDRIREQMAAWNTPRGTVPGGFLFAYDDMVDCEDHGNAHTPVSDYAKAVNETTGS